MANKDLYYDMGFTAICDAVGKQGVAGSGRKRASAKICYDYDQKGSLSTRQYHTRWKEPLQRGGEERQTRVASHAVERQVRAAAAGNEQADRSAIAALLMIT